jgi:hypothetical protein
MQPNIIDMIIFLLHGAYNFFNPKQGLSMILQNMPLCKDHHGFGVFFKLFSGCGISSNSLLIYWFTCVYLLNGLLISALGFTDVFICVYATNNKKRQPWNIPQPYAI